MSEWEAELCVRASSAAAVPAALLGSAPEAQVLRAQPALHTGSISGTTEASVGLLDRAIQSLSLTFPNSLTLGH